MTIRTSRLTLVPVTLPLVDAALAGNAALHAVLGVRVPESWPHEFLDTDAWNWLRERMPASGDSGWWFYFAIARDDAGDHLVGSCGYKGPPDDDATVEIGYGMVPEQRLQGYASEMADALVARAFAVSDVRRVIAETMPELVGSIGVLRRCGFTQVDGASEPGAIRFGVTRARFEARARVT
ncbi:MAG TPA: GNAT family protein [Gemmatimonadaceae bacterium]|nr:GNAT family protein [Gemmatimonadaceae bacterium]